MLQQREHRPAVRSLKDLSEIHDDSMVIIDEAVLMTPTEVDDLLRLPPGKSERLARRDLLPHVKLPDKTIRFRTSEIETLIGVDLAHDDRHQEAPAHA